MGCTMTRSASPAGCTQGAVPRQAPSVLHSQACFVPRCLLAAGRFCLRFALLASRHDLGCCRHRTTAVTANGALVSSAISAGPYAVDSGILSLTALTGNTTDVGRSPVLRIVAPQGAWLRVTNAETGESEIFALLAGTA